MPQNNVVLPSPLYQVICTISPQRISYSISLKGAQLSRRPANRESRNSSPSSERCEEVGDKDDIALCISGNVLLLDHEKAVILQKCQELAMLKEVTALVCHIYCE